MSAVNQYKWLIVVESETDANTYSDLLIKYGVQSSDFALFPVSGKPNVCNATTWSTRKSEIHNSDLLKLVQQDLGRIGFVGVLLVVDSDEDDSSVFKKYKRNADSSLYVDDVPPPIKKISDTYWELDVLNGASGAIPVIGISVPIDSAGCLETDLLSSYGFPTEGQPEYSCLTDIVKKSSDKWNIPKHGDGKD